MELAEEIARKHGRPDSDGDEMNVVQPGELMSDEDDLMSDEDEYNDGPIVTTVCSVD